MGDDLGDEWWQHEGKAGQHSCIPPSFYTKGQRLHHRNTTGPPGNNWCTCTDPSEAEEEEEEEETEAEKQPTEKSKAEKRKRVAERNIKAKKKKDNEQKACVVPPKKKEEEAEDEKSAKPKKKRKKKKTITDVLAAAELKPGGPADLQDLVSQFFSDKRCVIEQEELRLQNSCFLSSNDLTHSLSSYLKLVCPKWAKIQKQHSGKSSVILLLVCSSALRAIELIKQLTAFKGEAKAVKLFAKHIKIEEQMKLLQKGVTHIGVGTPGRISALIEKEGLSLGALKYVVLDWNWRDQKLRRMVDIPEIKLDFMKLLESGILAACKEDKIKIGLF
ncbi:protein CMSS1 isoform X2 [Parambassis ranga]|uniref:Protein CMSS1 isoform X2 n=1 Tax=Parambassis ranga TaxID=210632 RepID=A0A6P7HE80_9TELE|nr:protein CMSS1 isoform X2 [Parambassis ranga]